MNDKLNKKLAKHTGYKGTAEDTTYLGAAAKAEKNKKLAEWAEFKRSKYTTRLYDYPNGERVCSELPDFTESLDACFKWLVSKLYRMDGFRLLSYQYIGFSQEIDLLRHGWGIQFEGDVGYYASERESAPALCLAIEKLIDGEK